MTITASIDMSKMLAVIRQFPSQTITTQDDFLKEQCRLLISTSGRKQRGIVQVTPPHSPDARGSDAKKQGERAVSRDLAKVYANSGAAFAALKAVNPGLADAFWQARRQGKTGKGRGRGSKKEGIQLMNEILSKARGLPSFMSRIQEFDGGAAHEARYKNGRLRGRSPSLLLFKTSKLNTYRKRKNRNIGIMASMIPFAASFKLGSLKGVPSWVRRHHKSGGYVTPRKNPKGTTFTIGVTNYVVSNMQRRMNYVLDYRMRAVKLQLPYIAKRLEKKLQAAINAA